MNSTAGPAQSCSRGTTHCSLTRGAPSGLQHCVPGASFAQEAPPVLPSVCATHLVSAPLRTPSSVAPPTLGPLSLGRRPVTHAVSGGLQSAVPGVLSCMSRLGTRALCCCVTVSCYCPVPAVTPPGFYSDGGDTLPCPDGSFRSDWKPPAEATTCTNCGTGVLTAKTDRVTNYNISSGEEISIPVTTSASDCYIQAGQGLYYETLTQTWRAKDCDKNSYGVQNTTFGLTPAPCRDCE